jgi:hypothetical protein
LEVDSEPLKGNADVRELFLGLTDIYQSKDGKQEKVFDALEWLAAMCSHVPDKVERPDGSSKARPARPGATRLSVVGLDDATHQT